MKKRCVLLAIAAYFALIVVSAEQIPAAPIVRFGIALASAAICAVFFFLGIVDVSAEKKKEQTEAAKADELQRKQSEQQHALFMQQSEAIHETLSLISAESKKMCDMLNEVSESIGQASGQLGRQIVKSQEETSGKLIEMMSQANASLKEVIEADKNNEKEVSGTISKLQAEVVEQLRQIADHELEIAAPFLQYADQFGKNIADIDNELYDIKNEIGDVVSRAKKARLAMDAIKTKIDALLDETTDTATAIKENSEIMRQSVDMLSASIKEQTDSVTEASRQYAIVTERDTHILGKVFGISDD